MTTMTTALIGHTGFVGSNLARQFKFDEFYSSRNIDDIRGRSFDLLVCAGVSAEKWIANRDPDGDKGGISKLLGPLRNCNCKSAILISTIDVFPVLVNVDEDFDCHSMPNHAYGRNRLEVEEFFLKNFTECTIVRLPGLFGWGLKKNVIYDLLNDNLLEKINPESFFQWYCLDWLWSDIQTIQKADINLIVFATEPIVTSEIITKFFPGKEVGVEKGLSVRYDVHTKHFSIFNGRNSYIRDREEVMNALALYVRRERGDLQQAIVP